MPVGVEDQQHAAGLQHPQPLAIDLQMLPDDVGHIAADNEIEGLVTEGQSTEIPPDQLRRHAEARRVLPRVIKHPLRAVDARDPVPRAGQKHGEEPGAAAGVQYPQGPGGRGILLNDPEPLLRPIGGEFLLHVVVVVVRADRPVRIDLFLCEHAFFSFCHIVSTEDSSRFVYASLGSRMICAVGPCSTTRPPQRTYVLSQKLLTSARSWE